jgi:glyoxylase-like metal-dependent hydrolase (beta-lactamase superfamily II)
MQQNRREFIVTSSLAVAAGALGPVRLLGQQPPAAAQPPATPLFTPLRRNVATFTARGGTMAYLMTPDAVLVIDSQFADTAQMFMDGLKTRTPRKIDLLLNTHHHPDHTGGNKVLRPMVAKIVAHRNVPALQMKQAAANKTEGAQAYADETFQDDWKVDIGNETVSTKYYGPGHTSGDAVVFFQRANIVHMGDLMSHQRHPRVDRPAGASIRNWLVSLEKVVKDHDDDTIYIYGHSKVGLPVTGPKADLLALRDYFTAMLDYVQKGIAAGKSADEIVKAGLPQFAQNEGTPALQVAYDELTSKS